MSSALPDLWPVFDARRVKAPNLRGLDLTAHGVVGWFKNKRRVLSSLMAQARRIERLEPEIHELSSHAFHEEVGKLRDEARLGRLEGGLFDRAMALAREAAVRSLGMRPFKVQIAGALGMCQGLIIEMATGEGKTLTASLAASLWGWMGRPVHVITVNDYLVQRDAEEMRPVYELLGLKVGHVIHESPAMERHDHYRRNVVYITSKELVADFLRDQIALGDLRTATQTIVGMLGTPAQRGRLQVPGLWRVLVDEADSLLIDEAVTPLIISNSPEAEGNASLYQRADALASQLEANSDFKIDRTIRNCDLTPRGQSKLDELSRDDSGFWQGQRRREELVTQALTARHCFIRDEQYLVAPDGKVQIIDEFTGRIMADRSWRHGLHQAIEVKEGVLVTADKENLARLSFPGRVRQYRSQIAIGRKIKAKCNASWQTHLRAF